MKLAFAGFRHAHIYSLLDWANTNPEIAVTAAWESDPQARQEAEKHGIRFTHDSYEQLLRDPAVEMVAIGNYYGARGAMVLAALRAGKSVMVDKPVCTSLQEWEQIRAQTAQGTARLGCMLDLRYRFAPQKAKQLIAAGELGAIHNIVFTACHPLNYGKRPGWYFETGKHGGTINDIAIHGMDLIRYMTGAGLRKIDCARCWNAYAKEEPDFRDCGQFMAELEGGIGLLADVSYASPSGATGTPGFYWRFDLFGERGTLEFNYRDDALHLLRTGGSGEEILTGEMPGGNPLSDFVASLRGEPAFLPQKEILAASHDVLLLQQAADAR